MKTHELRRSLSTCARTIAVLYVVLSTGSAWAAYDYNISQISPVSLTMTQITAILNQTAPNEPYLDAYRQMTTNDTTGSVMNLAPVKVVQTGDPKHPYLGVFHSQVTRTKFATFAAYSTDLAHWHTLGEIDDVGAGDYGSQPDIRILPDDSVLFAEEYNPADINRPRIRVRYYGMVGGQTGLDAFLTDPGGAPQDQTTLPNINRFSEADGTPEFGRIDYNGDLRQSKIEITHHYFDHGQRDIQAIGTLSQFQNWNDATDSTMNNLITQAGGNGKIGDRELFKVGNTVYEIVEAQVDPTSGGDFGSWRLFLVDRTTDKIEKLSPELVGGARSLGNPTVSFVTLPDGKKALVFTCFVFSENSGSTKAGGHMYVYPLN